MPHVGPVAEGRTFFCPHCGALYSVTHSRAAEGGDNTAKCVVCLKIMARWAETAQVPIFKLVHRPDDD
jgi:transcription elongation factor Elf1